MYFTRKVKVFLKSREIIDNWLSSALDYIRGKENIKIKVDGKEFTVSRWFYSDIVNMFYDKEIQGLSVKGDELLIKTRLQDVKADEFILSQGFSFLYGGLKNGWRYNGGILEKDDGSVRFKYISHSVYEIFNGKAYEGVEVSGKEVVDIGANVGDSAIYFALNGAKKVVGVEPLPSVYAQALENIKLNHLEDKIVMINAALGSKKGSIKVPCNINTYSSDIFDYEREW